MYIAEEGIPIVLEKKKSQNVEPCIIVFEKKKKKENVHGSSDTFP